MRVLWKYRSENGMVSVLTDGLCIEFTPKDTEPLVLSGKIIHTHYRVWDIDSGKWVELYKNDIVESRTSFEDESISSVVNMDELNEAVW